MSNICEDCVYYDYDQELEAFVCSWLWKKG